MVGWTILMVNGGLMAKSAPFNRRISRGGAVVRLVALWTATRGSAGPPRVLPVGIVLLPYLTIKRLEGARRRSTRPRTKTHEHLGFKMLDLVHHTTPIAIAAKRMPAGSPIAFNY